MPKFQQKSSVYISFFLTVVLSYLGGLIIVYIGASPSLSKTPLPLSCQAPPLIKLANCPSPPLLGNPPSILVFREPPPPKSWILQ